MEFQLIYSRYPSALILSLTLAACGGGGSSATDDHAVVASESAQTAATVNVATEASTDDTGRSASSKSATPVTFVAAEDNQASTAMSVTSPTPVPAPSAPQLIEYYGDSTVWGYRTNSGGQVAKPAPVAFAESLPNPSAYIVRNEGVSGTTACDLLNGTDGRHQPWSNQMAASSATYVFVNFAINDQWKHDLDTYKSCLQSLARTAKQYGKQMVFETPNPTRDSGSGGLDVYVNGMKEVAAQENVPVIDQYKYLSEYLNGQSPYIICPDGLHPTEMVYVMKGQYAAQAFANLFIK